MPHEALPGLYLLPIPLPDNPLSAVNAYVVRADDGVRLVDCGWDTPEAYAAMVGELAALGATVGDVRELLVTHIHPDHFGLAGRLVAESGARESMPRSEAALIGARYEDARELVTMMEEWLAAVGVPRDELEATAGVSLWMVSHVGTRRPDMLLDGGETLEWGAYRFEVIPTPGHSAGLVCLYDRAARVLLSSDHVLERTSPHIGLHVQSGGDPLGDYLRSLRRVRDLDVALVLPGHGAPFHDLAGRVDALIAHHERRCAQMLDILADGALTPYDLASRLPWRGAPDGWQRLDAFPRRLAVTETVAHLEYLRRRDRLTRRIHDGVALYRPGAS